jgi:hypothetical protein
MIVLNPVILKVGLIIVALIFLRVLVDVFMGMANIVEEWSGSRRLGIVAGILVAGGFAFLAVLLYLEW